MFVSDNTGNSSILTLVDALLSSVAAKYAQLFQDWYQTPLPDDEKLIATASNDYIELAIIRREGVRHRETEELTEKILHGQIEDILKKKRLIALGDLLKSEKRRAVRCVLVEGAPGVGKSTLAWEVCRKWKELEALKQYELVVLVQLRQTRAQKIRCFGDLLPSSVDINVDEFMAVIGRGKGVLIICDGFDELPREERQADSVFIKLIRGKVLPEAKIIVTSRPSVSADLWSQCQHSINSHLEVIGFTRQKVNEYAESIFSGEKLKGFKAWINNPKLPIYGLMHHPLNATIVALTYKDSYDAEAPEDITQLYDAFMRTLIRRHLSDTKRVDPEVFCMPQSLRCEKDISQLPCDVAQQLKELAKVAYEGLLTERYVFTELGENFCHLGMMKKTITLDPSVGRVCSFNFLHLTLQEYMTALHLSLQCCNTGDTPFKVTHSLYDRETVRTFLAGLCKPDCRTFCRVATEAEEKLDAKLKLSRQISEELEQKLQVKETEVAQKQEELEKLKQKSKPKAKLILIKLMEKIMYKLKCTDKYCI